LDVSSCGFLQHCEAIGDPEMTHALRACERKKMKEIMTFQYDWNDEVIAQFYSTLWVKLADEDSPYNYPYLNFYIEGSWYKVSYCRFAHILGFTDNDISGDKIKIHDFRQPTRDEARDLHLVSLGNFGSPPTYTSITDTSTPSAG
jgi:hypothetical protein